MTAAEHSGRSDKEYDGTYSIYLELEDLESLLEEIEEYETVGDSGVDLPHELRERLAESGARSVGELRTRIAHLHSDLDRAE